MAVQGSTLYGGSVSADAIYQITQGTGFKWNEHMRTEILMDGKPRQLTRAIHAGNPFQDDIRNPEMSDFVGNPTVTVDGRLLTVSPMAIRDVMNPTQWKETFPKYQPSGPSNNLSMSPEVQKTILDLTLDAAKNQLNDLHARGDDTLTSPDPLRFYDGIIKLILADADCTQVGVAGAITLANVLDTVYDMRDAVEPRLRMHPDLKTFCSIADYDLYDRARRATQTQMATTDLGVNDKVIQANGAKITLIPNESIPVGFMFTTIASTKDTSNLVQGVWVKNDAEALMITKMKDTDLDIVMQLRMSMGVNYKSGKDIYFRTAS